MAFSDSKRTETVARKVLIVQASYRRKPKAING